MSIPGFILKHRAVVKRLNVSTENWDTVYQELPCYIGKTSGFPGTVAHAISSVEYRETVLFSYEFNHKTLALRQDDRIIVNNETYLVKKIYDAETQGHHLEVGVERVD